MNTKALENEKFHLDSAAKMVPFAGYNMPMWYSSIADEHNSVRDNVGVFDVSHMGEFIVTGDFSKDFLQMVTTNDLNKLSEGKIQYTSILNRSGGIIDDLLLYDLGDNRYMLVVNASNMEKDLRWLKENNNLNVEIDDISDRMSLFAVQGPNAIDVCNKVFKKDLSELKYFTFIKLTSGDYGDLIISATGYTGAGGLEIYTENKFAVKLWSDIIGIGKEYGIKPIGLGARDTLRLEMGFCLHGNDIDDSINPIQAGLGWICKKDIEFIGKKIIDRDRENNPSKILVGFELKERGIPRKGYKIFNKDGNLIGEVTSGSISPYTKKAIGMGYVNFDESRTLKAIFIEIRNKKVEAVISKRPFI